MRFAIPRIPAARRSRAAAASLLLAALLCPFGLLHAAPKTDVVVLQNGDRLTGEIKGLDKGKLELSTDSAGTVYIEWDKVASVTTNQYLNVETSRGARYFGKVPPGDRDGTMQLRIEGEPQGQTLVLTDVVRVKPIDQGSLIKRLDGYVTVGFDYTKADNQTEFNFSGGVSSRDEIREWTLDGAMTLNSQSGARTTSMYDVTLATKRFLQDRWFLGSFASVQGNDELGLNIREIVGAGPGRYFVQNLHHEWYGIAGLAASRENFQDEPTRNSLEAVLATQYSFFQYDTPKRNLDAGLALFPSLTEAGRLRAELDLDARYELVSDLFFNVTVYGSYDSKAVDAAQSKSDYGVVTSLGYSF
ncbi:MAG: DUF481 domain-containing protein [Gammaproteobacteria bacterium]|nr:DUF481 domain-containing protein [Gammaproteobacteria bacterium]